MRSVGDPVELKTASTSAFTDRLRLPVPPLLWLTAVLVFPPQATRTIAATANHLESMSSSAAFGFRSKSVLEGVGHTKKTVTPHVRPHGARPPQPATPNGSSTTCKGSNEAQDQNPRHAATSTPRRQGWTRAADWDRRVLACYQRDSSSSSRQRRTSAPTLVTSRRSRSHTAPLSRSRASRKRTADGSTFAISVAERNSSWRPPIG